MKIIILRFSKAELMFIGHSGSNPSALQNYIKITSVGKCSHPSLVHLRKH